MLIAIRVLVVDDHAMFAESVARLFERETDMSVVGVAATSAGAISLAQTSQPDVAVVDFGLPDADGAQTAAAIRAVSPQTNVLLLTGLADDGIATAAIQAGCSGFLTKDKAAGELVAAVRTVHAGEAHIPPSHLVDLQRGLAIERLKAEFVSRIGHEFRSPLTAILGYGRIMARRATASAADRELSEQIVASGERLQRIVEILEFTASSSCGKLSLDAKSIDVAALVGGVVRRWSSAPATSGHTITLDAIQPVDVTADTHWLAMALDEIIDNAVKFSPAGGRVVVAAPTVEFAGAPAVEIVVTDQGIGMSAAVRQMAFEEFMQLDSSDTRSFGGLGLGLALVRGVALAHGGAVSCSAVEPAGTRMSITIPSSNHR